MLNSRFALVTFIGLAGLAASPAATFTITKLGTVKHASGGDVDYTPAVGETYSLGIHYTQAGKAGSAYDILFRLADKWATVHVTDTSPGDKYYSADFTLPLDDKIDIQATVDPAGQEMPLHGATKTGSFTPTPPSSALDFYDEVELQVKQTMTYPLQPNGKYSFHFLSGVPITDGWQTATISTLKVNGKNVPSVKMPMPTLFPLFYWAGSGLTSPTVSTDEECVVKVRAQRVNPDKLRQVTWADIDALPGIDVFKYFTQPEAVIQSTSPVIKQYVENALGGANYRSKYKPYDACRKVFQYVVAHCNYFYPKPGQPDNRAQNAVEMAQKGIGDCGSFSMLLVACYRHMGIPARDACGAWIGTDAGHCWSEMWFPKAGWIVTDGSLSDLTSTSGKYAYYFGYIPDLNARFAIMRGNTFSYADASTSWLQGPMWTPIVSNAALLGGEVTGHTVVTEVTQNAGSILRANAHLIAPAWNVHDLQRLQGKFLLKPVPRRP